VHVVGAVTQPDRPVGRKQVLTPPPVKELAQAHGIPVLQPVALGRPAALAAFQRFKPDVGIVAAYGRILPASVLAVPPLGHLNVHASLLPRWRGAWPIGAAILEGDAETGVAIMKLDEGMDTGPVLSLRSEPIRADDTTESLEKRLATLGAALLVETLPGYLGGAVSPQPQNESAATYCRPVRKADGIIDWTKPAVQIERLVRAMHPWPGAFTTWDGKQLRVARAHVSPSAEAQAPGTVVAQGKGAAVTTGDGLLVLDEVQIEGKGQMPIKAFLNGYRSFAGSTLGG
jgi:methionyl-tRNA formyltransferase